jgi:EAL domain-containing protein (putative c-di-GMP-specific phosphodiesterase class I)
VRDQAAHLAVNVSALQLRQGDFSARLLAELDYYARPRLELEITETTVLDPKAPRSSTCTACAAGMGISLDDFGRGYAGLPICRRCRCPG